MTLDVLLAEWNAWSATADRASDGWESDFPKWPELVATACATMLGGHADARAIEALGECFKLAEEDEELLDFARAHIKEVLPVLEKLAISDVPECRWQVYAALVGVGAPGIGVLRGGLRDPDDYARRRAILALAEHRPPDAQTIAESLFDDRDPYIRLASISMVAAAADDSFRRHALTRLANDEVDFVRAAANDRLQ